MPRKRSGTKALKTQATLKLRGKGDYEVSDSGKAGKAKVDVPATLARIEKKIDKSNAEKPSGPGASLGRAAGSLLGQGDLGAAAGSALSKYFGFGDYELVSNSLIKLDGPNSKSNSIPFGERHGKRGVRFCEREYLGDLVAGSGVPSVFSNRSFRINPADPGTFPWLSQIACLFEEWEPMGLVFEFVSTSADYGGAASQALGTVITATEYDPTDAAFPNKIVMESSDYCKSTRPSNNLEHGIECDARERPTEVLFCSTTAPTASADKRFTDLGIFQIATQGMPVAGVVLGEIWVSYDIVFYKKQLLGNGVGGNILDYCLNVTSGVTTATPFGTSATRAAFGSLNIAITSEPAGQTVFAFPPSMSSGSFEVEFFCSAATGCTEVDPVLFNLVNCSLSATIPSGGSTIGYSTNGAAVPNVTARAVLTLTGPNASFTFGSILVVGNALSQLRVYQMNTAPLIAL